MDLVVMVSFWFGGLLLALMPIPRILAWLGPIGVVALVALRYQQDSDSQSTLIVLTGLVAVAIAITFVLCGYVLRHFLERS